MGRGRSGNTVSSKRKCAQGNNQNNAFFITNGRPYTTVCGLTQEQIEALKHLSNAQLAEAIPSPAARPSTPREQTLSSGHRAGSTPRENQAS